VGNYDKRKPLQDDNLQILRTQVFRFHNQNKLKNKNNIINAPQWRPRLIQSGVRYAHFLFDLHSPGPLRSNAQENETFEFHSFKREELDAAFQFPATPKGRLEGNRKVRQLDGDSSARRRAGR
jgi:hypothetical protein